MKNDIHANSAQRNSTPLHAQQSQCDAPENLADTSGASGKFRFKKPASSLDSALRVRPGSGAGNTGHTVENSPASSFQPTFHELRINPGFVINLAQLNCETNTVTVSKKGKTSKAIVVIEPAKAKILAILKSVNQDEIFANKLFAALGMPIPSFQTFDKSKFSNTIKSEISTTPLGNSETHQTILAMQCVNGKAMSEIAPEDLKDFLLAGENLELLGMSMALDTLTGNADRIITFAAPTINPDNIMFDLESKSVVFIDQGYKDRQAQLDVGLSKLAKFFGPQQLEAPSVYTQYILPLAIRSIQKYCIEELNIRDQTKVKELISGFENLIDKNQKNDISILVTSGISRGFQLLAENKDAVLKLCSEDPAQSEGIKNAYSILAKYSDRFKENTSR